MNAMVRILEWPVDADDVLPLALWDAQSIAAATGGTASAEFQVSGVEIDSRDVVEGDLFFALKGEAMDGHRFIESAFAKPRPGAGQPPAALDLERPERRRAERAHVDADASGSTFDQQHSQCAVLHKLLPMHVPWVA